MTCPRCPQLEADIAALKAELEAAKTRPAKPSIESAFAEWYSHYPRKVGKADAAKAFPLVLASIATERCNALAWLIEVTKLFAASPSGNAGKFTPHPATWLNQGRYDDDPSEWQRGENVDPRGNIATAQRMIEKVRNGQSRSMFETP